MELKDIIKILRKSRGLIVISIFLGFLIGLVFNFLPPKYTSSGSIYVKRSINASRAYFTYEGYYAQQTAQAYTNSVVALLESADIKKKVLQLMNLPINERNIRELDRAINAKKIGPQIINVSVKDKNYDKSVEIWDKTVNSLIGITSDMNRGGDENLGISLISERPVVRESFRSLYLFGIVGSLISLTLSLLYICIREYLRD